MDVDAVMKLADGDVKAVEAALIAALPPWSGCSACVMCGNAVGTKAAKFEQAWPGRPEAEKCTVCDGRGALLSGPKCLVCKGTGTMGVSPATPRHMTRTCECGYSWDEKTLADSGKDGE